MKVLLQDLISLNYLSVSGDWTDNTEEAMDFGEVIHAVDCVLSRGLRHVRVVIKFPGPQHDLELPPVQAVGR